MKSEVLHTLGLLHMDDITNRYVLREHGTDNIMEGFEEDENIIESRQRSTYKWQWDIVWKIAGKDRQIPNDD